ncbi:hypothetical protein BgiBS90_014548, partial [Biomphalaria glabrata]
MLLSRVLINEDVCKATQSARSSSAHISPARVKESKKILLSNYIYGIFSLTP